MKERVFEPQSSSVCYKYTRNNTYNVPCIQTCISFLSFIHKKFTFDSDFDCHWLLAAIMCCSREQQYMLIIMRVMCVHVLISSANRHISSPLNEQKALVKSSVSTRCS